MPVFISSNKIPPSDKKNVTYANQVTSKSLKIRIKSVLMKYISGYKMYMDVQTGLIPSHHIRNFIYKKSIPCTYERKSCYI